MKLAQCRTRVTCRPLEWSGGHLASARLPVGSSPTVLFDMVKATKKPRTTTASAPSASASSGHAATSTAVSAALRAAEAETQAEAAEAAEAADLFRCAAGGGADEEDDDDELAEAIGLMIEQDSKEKALIKAATDSGRLTDGQLRVAANHVDEDPTAGAAEEGLVEELLIEAAANSSAAMGTCSDPGEHVAQLMSLWQTAAQ
eukprot:1325329-Pyramimonas_sp.AAC.1